MDFAVYPFKREKKVRLYVKFTDKDGEKRARSTGISYPHDASKSERKQAKKKAEKCALNILSDYLAQREQAVVEENQAPLLSDYLEEHYYPQVQASCAASTVVSYKKSLRYFLRIVGDKPLDAYDRQMIHKFKLHRFNEDGVKKTTINIEIRSIKAAFSWATKNEYLMRDPYRGKGCLFSNVKMNKRAFKHYEIEKILKQTEGKVIGLAVRLAYFSGMRIGEMSKLKWGMIRYGGEKPHIDLSRKMTKTKEGRKIPFGGKAHNILKILEHVLAKKMKQNPEYYDNLSKQECYVLQKERGHGHYAPRSIQQKFRRMMNAAGLPKELTFHCLRHSYATHLLEKGANLNGVSKILGHSKPNVTEEFYDDTDALNYQHIANMI